MVGAVVRVSSLEPPSQYPSDFGGVWYETQSEIGAVKIVGYTSSTWNFYVDVYGIK